MKTTKNNDNLSPEQVKGKIVDLLEENHIDLPDEIRRTIEKYLLAPLEKTKEVEEASNGIEYTEKRKHQKETKITKNPKYSDIMKKTRSREISISDAADALNCSKASIYNHLDSPRSSIDLKIVNNDDGTHENSDRYNMTATLEGKFNDNNFSVTAHIDNIPDNGGVEDGGRA